MMIYNGICYTDQPYYSFTTPATIHIRDLTDLSKPIHTITTTDDYVAFFTATHDVHGYIDALLQVGDKFFAPPHSAWHLQASAGTFASCYTSLTACEMATFILSRTVVNPQDFTISSSNRQAVLSHNLLHDLVLIASHEELAMSTVKVQDQWEKQIEQPPYYIFLQDPFLVARAARKDPRLNPTLM